MYLTFTTSHPTQSPPAANPPSPASLRRTGTHLSEGGVGRVEHLLDLDPQPVEQSLLGRLTVATNDGDGQAAHSL